jgi:hypothetical protein
MIPKHMSKNTLVTERPFTKILPVAVWNKFSFAGCCYEVQFKKPSL